MPFFKKNTKIFISPYQLKFKDKKKNPSVLEGVLMAFDFDSKLKGYADFLPWTSYGEKSLDQQLDDITQGIESNRFQMTKKNAWLDAVARFKKQNLFYGLKMPPSHFLIENLFSFSEQKDILRGGYKYVKVKLSPLDLDQQIKKLKKIVGELPKTIKYRLDLYHQKWSLWKEPLHFMKTQIDFIEDPFLDIQKIKEEDCSFFAEDWVFNSRCKIRIVKPTRDCLDGVTKELAFSRWKRIVFTHSFDHPLGQATSAYWAAKFYQIHPSFFETSALKCFAFEENNFYFHNSKNPFLEIPKGFGFGFDKCLQAENWKRLV